MRLKPVAQPGAERSIVDRAADLEQEIGTCSGPAHLLRLVHSSIDEKVCGSLGDRSSDAQLGTVSLGVVDEPTTLTSEIAVDVKQRVPQPARRRVPRVLAEFLRTRSMLRVAFFALPFQMRQRRRSTSSVITIFARIRPGLSA